MSKHAVKMFSQFEAAKLFAAEPPEIGKREELRRSIERILNISSWLAIGIVFIKGMILHVGITLGMHILALEAAAGRITSGNFVTSQAIISQLSSPLQ
jgi:ABC-type transport system involved in Fe-S cluster assembly fused permease/ATPase subunit